MLAVRWGVGMRAGAPLSLCPAAFRAAAPLVAAHSPNALLPAHAPSHYTALCTIVCHCAVHPAHCCIASHCSTLCCTTFSAALRATAPCPLVPRARCSDLYCIALPMGCCSCAAALISPLCSCRSPLHCAPHGAAAWRTLLQSRPHHSPCASLRCATRSAAALGSAAGIVLVVASASAKGPTA